MDLGGGVTLDGDLRRMDRTRAEADLVADELDNGRSAAAAPPGPRSSATQRVVELALGKQPTSPRAQPNRVANPAGHDWTSVGMTEGVRDSMGGAWERRSAR